MLRLNDNNALAGRPGTRATRERPLADPDDEHSEATAEVRLRPSILNFTSLIRNFLIPASNALP